VTAGTGRGAITDDGCPVELYLRFPHQGEADLVHAAVPAGATVLDLGCGTGRIAHPLIELGHPVTAVDASAEMLAHVRGAHTVHSRIADLDLARPFDVVLMASHRGSGTGCATTDRGSPRRRRRHPCGSAVGSSRLCRIKVESRP
jgi:SAM-dependent methyltransferase